MPESNVLFTITNTDPTVPWLVNHLETLLVQLWYPCTVATISREQKKVIKAALEKSGQPVDRLPISACMTSGIGAAPVWNQQRLAGLLIWLISSELIQSWALNCCAGTIRRTCPEFRFPAAEHSTITAWGRDREEDAYRHILQQYPEGFVSVVSDSWDVIKACRRYMGRHA